MKSIIEIHKMFYAQKYWVKAKELYSLLEENISFKKWCKQYLLNNPFALMEEDFAEYSIKKAKDKYVHGGYFICISLAKKIAIVYNSGTLESYFDDLVPEAHIDYMLHTSQCISNTGYLRTSCF